MVDIQALHEFCLVYGSDDVGLQALESAIRGDPGLSQDIARLILAAPKLLKALRLFAALDAGTIKYAGYATRFDIPHSAILAARAAVAKATGKES